MQNNYYVLSHTLWVTSIREVLIMRICQSYTLRNALIMQGYNVKHSQQDSPMC